MTKEIMWFSEIHKNNIPEVGGKGANLGEMLNAGFPVPQGFCVTAQAYERFIKKAGIAEKIYKILDKVDENDTATLQKAAVDVQEIILEAKVPLSLQNEITDAYENMEIDLDVLNAANKKTLGLVKAGRNLSFVAVRSSATAEDLPTASFAGQQKTFLNIKGKENLLRAVQQCWASLFTARAIFYRVKNKFDHRKVLIAIIVQKMVDSDKAGVAFSVNPSTNNESEIVIEGAYGLGEALVSGAIKPDNYLVDKNTLKVKEIKLGKQTFAFMRDERTGETIKKPLKDPEQVLQEPKIKELARIVKKIEEHYKVPQDIEWAVENKRILITQSRPITTLKEKHIIKDHEVKKIEGSVIITGLNASPGVGTGPVKIIKGSEDLSRIQDGDVLVTKMTDPDMVMSMQKAAAIITDEGGTTCHAAIVSREMGIPAVVGTINATEKLKEGQIVTVSGAEGKVYSGKIKEEIEEKHPEPEITPGEKIETNTKIKVIMDLPQFAEKAAATGADGVGLIRCEFIILGKKEHPIYLIENNRKDELVNEIYEGVKKITQAFKGKPVWYRTLDAPTDEFRKLKGGEKEPEEDNPMMGWRSVRRSIDQPELLKAELEAIKKIRDEGLTNLGLMIPLVTSVDQIEKVKEYIDEMGLEDMDYGVMIETPASVQIIEDICKTGIKFVSFGTNDLTQFTLAVDRNNAKIQNLYDEMHPAVLKQIEHVIKVCKENNVETSICGQAGSKEEMAEFLVKTGIDSITTNIDAVQSIRKTVSKVEKRLYS